MLCHSQYTQVAFRSFFSRTRRLKTGTLDYSLEVCKNHWEILITNWFIRGSALGPIGGLSARQSNSCLPEEKRRRREDSISTVLHRQTLVQLYRKSVPYRGAVGTLDLDGWVGTLGTVRTAGNLPKPLPAVPTVTKHQLTPCTSHHISLNGRLPPNNGFNDAYINILSTFIQTWLWAGCC